MRSTTAAVVRHAASVPPMLRAVLRRFGTPVLSVVLSVVFLTLPAAWAAFTGSTSNPSSTVGAGTVTLSDNDSNDTLKLMNVTGMLPGDTVTGCVKVTYTGTLPATVKLYATGGTGLATYLDLTVTKGTISGAVSVPSCTGFVADTIDYKGSGAGVLYSGTLASYPATAGAGQQDLHNAAGLAEAWTTNEVHAYKFVATLQNNVAAQGLTSSPVFGWAADNTTTYASVIQSDDPVGYWKLDEAAGGTATDTIAARNGTYTNGPVLNQTSEVKDANTSVTFDGTNDRAIVAYNAALNPANFTVEAWVKPTALPSGYGTAVGSSYQSGATGRGYWLGLKAAGTWELQVGKGGTGFTKVTGSAATLNSWAHLVGTYDGTTARLYVNGALANSGATTFTANSSAGFGIGAWYSNDLAAWTDHGAAGIDEVAVYNTALSLQQIQEHYNTGKR